jgi:hypothetical protein
MAMDSSSPWAFLAGGKSVDGLTWTPITFSNTLNAITFGSGQFAAVGAVGTILTSPDAVTWSNHVGCYHFKRCGSWRCQSLRSRYNAKIKKTD